LVVYDSSNVPGRNRQETNRFPSFFVPHKKERTAVILSEARAARGAKSLP
jgi:hypothetical protein